jgi:hypothetical protein
LYSKYGGTSSGAQKFLVKYLQNQYNSIDGFSWHSNPKKDFDGNFTFEVSKEIEENQYKNEPGFSSYTESNNIKHFSKVIARITVGFNGFDYNLKTLFYPWKIDSDYKTEKYVEKEDN